LLVYLDEQLDLQPIGIRSKPNVPNLAHGHAAQVDTAAHPETFSRGKEDLELQAGSCLRLPVTAAEESEEKSKGPSKAKAHGKFQKRSREIRSRG
jgi:hypothetical protein